eukprot:gene26742-48151_t
MGIIIPFAGTNIPDGWLPCDGRLLKVSDYGTFYSIIGNQFGGVSQVDFNLPNLNGSIPVGAGQGNQLSNYTVGQQGGTGIVSLNQNQLPTHTHSFVVSGSSATSNSPSNNFLANTNDPSTNPAGIIKAFSNAASNGTLNTQTVANSGIGMGHNNLMPSLTIQYIICFNGTYPNPQ